MNLSPISDRDDQTGLLAARGFLLIFSFLAAGLVTVGYLSYKNYEQQYRTETVHQLSAIAELKVGELSRYRNARLGDGNVFYKNPAFFRLVHRFFEQPADADAQRQLLGWLGRLSQYGQYDRVWLLDAQGVTRLSVPGGQQPSASATVQLVSDVLRSGRTTFQDFYRNEKDRRVYLALMVPILDEPDTNRPLGVLVLRIDPSAYLYPFIQRWPVPSETAETLLVRREGNEAVFLNDLRFTTNAALNLHISLESTNTPAVMAVLGTDGIVEGRDYRGSPVIAAVHPIPDSPWFMVARQNTAEMLAPLQARLWQTVVVIGALLFGTAAGLGLIRRQQRVQFYRERAKSAEMLSASEFRYRRFFEATQDGVLILDAGTGMIIDVNPFLIKLLGYTHEVFLGKKIWELSFFRDVVANQDHFAELQQKEYIRYEDMALETSDGRRIEVEFTSHVYQVHHQTVIQCSVRDISARKKAERNLNETMDELRASNRDLEQFAYVASHDLQEPLRMVSSYMQLIDRRYKDRLDQDARDFIAYAVDGAVRMQNLIDSLLEYSRLQSRKKPFAAVNLTKVFGQALLDLEGRILETGAQITAGSLPVVRGDAVQLGRVFQNLIGNALKFRGEKTPEVRVEAEEFSTHWKITVRDNGIGIEPEHQKKLFKIFQRLHSRAEYPGTGIGLAVCKRIIERHGGETGVESVHGMEKGVPSGSPFRKKEDNHGRLQSN